ncbi:uncharacterized protein C8Q71DRAFT_330626 [Rhodofomes roseus]|uniref:Secreted protein n=1 Tax=Rhodofomes roseus TaxID=34475 RepID=A0ABQ8KRT9_9APHY|nr:uncharacterized protein C8Q71DRAFT_330626 [Rhodofomes roseus]KAH9841462.1 hypothetical protein C8Q71DRAFT_330626 [Rhodofomes roseus]
MSLQAAVTALLSELIGGTGCFCGRQRHGFNSRRMALRHQLRRSLSICCQWSTIQHVTTNISAAMRFHCHQECSRVASSSSRCSPAGFRKLFGEKILAV